MMNLTRVCNLYCKIISKKKNKLPVSWTIRKNSTDGSVSKNEAFIKVNKNKTSTTSRLVFTPTDSKNHLNLSQSPKYTLISLRSFPSLEPHSFVPLPAYFFDLSLRRDLLWSAVVYESDNARFGSENVPTKSDRLFSHRKLRPQKGTGRARVGDGNSPSRFNKIKAHGVRAPHDWSTKLPSKIYAKAFHVAFSDQYKNGRLFLIGNDNESSINKDDTTVLDSNVDSPLFFQKFIEIHDLDQLNLLFITDSERKNLVKSASASASDLKKKISVIDKSEVTVSKLLKANRIYVEKPALQWLISKYTIT